MKKKGKKSAAIVGTNETIEDMVETAQNFGKGIKNEARGEYGEND